MSDLRALAEEATPGPWHVGEHSDTKGEQPFMRRDPMPEYPDLAIGTDHGKLVVSAYNSHCCTFPISVDVSTPDAAYIAAASPDRILALLDVVDAARVVCDPMVQDGGGDRWWQAHDDLRAALDRLP